MASEHDACALVAVARKDAQPTRAVIFEDCRVPIENRLGAEGMGFKIAMAGLDGGRLNIGACSLGGAQSALDKALAYMKQRTAFGKRLEEFQALQFRLADMATELEAARTLLWRAAAALEPIHTKSKKAAMTFMASPNRSAILCTSAIRTNSAIDLGRARWSNPLDERSRPSCRRYPPRRTGSRPGQGAPPVRCHRT